MYNDSSYEDFWRNYQAGTLNTQQLIDYLKSRRITADEIDTSTLILGDSNISEVDVSKLIGQISDDNIESASRWNIQGTYIDQNGIYTGVINANQINTGYLSADRIYGGTLTGVNMNLAGGNFVVDSSGDVTLRGTIYSSGNFGDLTIDEGYIVMGSNNGFMTLNTTTLEFGVGDPYTTYRTYHLFMGSDSYYDVGYIDSDTSIEVRTQLVQSVSETGFCGCAGMASSTLTNRKVAGQGVNFRIKKNYVPSSVSLSTISSNASPNIASITTDGFYLYLYNGGVDGDSYGWYGRYTA